MRISFPFYQDAGWLLIRVGLGVVFVVHGLLKWQDLSGTSQLFAGLGLPAGTVYLVAAVELVGGLAVIFGWFTRFFSLGLAIIMVVVIVTVKWPQGFVGGYEFDLVLLLMALSLVLAGPGRYRLKVANWGRSQF